VFSDGATVKVLPKRRAGCRNGLELKAGEAIASNACRRVNAVTHEILTFNPLGVNGKFTEIKRLDVWS
jgi:hypothetical protein